MNNPPFSGEKVEVTASLSADFVHDIDEILKIFEKKSPEKQLSKFIEEALEEWYLREWKRLSGWSAQ